MPAYVIADITVTDHAGFEEYKKAVAATIATFGGSYVARGGAVEALEGDWSPARLTVLKFDSVAQAKAWYHSAEYRPLRDLRKKSTNSNLLVVDGL